MVKSPGQSTRSGSLRVRKSLSERLSQVVASSSQLNGRSTTRNNDDSVDHDHDGDDNDNQSMGRIKVKLLTDVQRKEAVLKYRSIYNQIKNTDSDSDEFRELLQKLKLYIDQQNQCLMESGINELVVLDAKCMAITTELSYGLVKKFNTCSKFDAKRFIHGLKQRLIKHSNTAGVLGPTISGSRQQKQPLRFEHLYGAGLVYRKYHYQCPALVKAFQSSDQTPMERKKRTVSNRQQLPNQATKSTQPTQFNSKNDKDNVDESDKRLSMIYARLKKLQKRNNNLVPFVQASINPKSFSVTVENFFNMSFLARQSLISITADSDPSTTTTNGNISKLSQNLAKSKNAANDAEESDNTDNEDEADSSLSDCELTAEPMVKIIELEREDGEPVEDDDDEDGDESFGTKMARLSKLNKQLDRSDDIQSILSLDTDVYRTLIENLEITRAALK